jgi:hypothetical protein
MDEHMKMFWLQFRQGLLVIIGAIEQILSITPTTSDLRKQWRENIINQGHEPDEGRHLRG